MKLQEALEKIEKVGVKQVLDDKKEYFEICVKQKDVFHQDQARKQASEISGYLQALKDLGIINDREKYLLRVNYS